MPPPGGGDGDGGGLGDFAGGVVGGGLVAGGVVGGGLVAGGVVGERELEPPVAPPPVGAFDDVPELWVDADGPLPGAGAAAGVTVAGALSTTANHVFSTPWPVVMPGAVSPANR